MSEFNRNPSLKVYLIKRPFLINRAVISIIVVVSYHCLAIMSNWIVITVRVSQWGIKFLFLAAEQFNILINVLCKIYLSHSLSLSPLVHSTSRYPLCVLLFSVLSGDNDASSAEQWVPCFVVSRWPCVNCSCRVRLRTRASQSSASWDWSSSVTWVFHPLSYHQTHDHNKMTKPIHPFPVESGRERFPAQVREWGSPLRWDGAEATLPREGDQEGHHSHAGHRR